MASALEELMSLREDPYSRAREWKERSGRPVIGYFCGYVPEEMIHAAGALPVRITGENRVVSKSGAHLQSYCCSLARTGLDMALEGQLGFLDGTAFVHTCDTMQRLSDTWRLNAGFSFHLDAVLPVRLEGPAAEDYARAELSRFMDKLGRAVGPIADDALLDSIRLYNRNRELLSRLYEMRLEYPGILTCDRSLWVTASSALMEKSEHNDLLERLIEELDSSGVKRGVDDDGGGSEGKVRLFGIGSVMDQWDFLEMLEEAGGTFVDDDFCTGHRYFEGEVEEGGDPVFALARRIFERGICPCKHRPSGDRATVLLRRMERSRAGGAIFFLFKFCEPHAFDYPHLKSALDGKGLPSLLLEIEHGSVSVEQLRTRVEALLETIAGY